MERKPTILVTNDDGYLAKGLRKLADLMRQIGKVVVVSTEQVKSAQGHSMTINEPLRLRQLEKSDDFEMYVLNGCPVDCAKVGFQMIMDEYPDILVSGINHGSNASTNVIYSGTMAAVVEACMDGIPAIGFSLEDYSPNANFDNLDNYILDITRKVLKEGLPPPDQSPPRTAGRRPGPLRQSSSARPAGYSGPLRNRWGRRPAPARTESRRFPPLPGEASGRPDRKNSGISPRTAPSARAPGSCSSCGSWS